MLCSLIGVQVLFYQFVAVVVVVFSYVLAHASDGGQEIVAAASMLVSVTIGNAETARSARCTWIVVAVFGDYIVGPVVSHAECFGIAHRGVEQVVAVHGGGTAVGVVVDYVVQPGVGAVQHLGFTFAHLAAVLGVGAQAELAYPIKAIVPGFAQGFRETKCGIGIRRETTHKTALCGAAIGIVLGAQAAR
jgi:hypothetical protein